MPPLRPNTLAQALAILARPMLVQVTAGGPPPHVQAHAQIMDVGRVQEMAGIQRARGEISVGSSVAWPRLQRSSLLKPAAACLADAAALLAEMQPGGVLLHALQEAAPDNPALLALTALEAKAEIASLAADDHIQRQIMPLRDAMSAQSERPGLLLALHFAAPALGAGSALYGETNLSPMQPDVRMAAAMVVIDPESGLVSWARLALAMPDAWPMLHPAASALVGRRPDAEAIETVARLAKRVTPQPRASSPPYSLTLSPHLIRKTLDIAIARAQNSLKGG